MGRKRMAPILISEIPEEDIDNGMVTQVNYQGEPEQLKASIYRYKLICRCGNARFYKAQDRKQVEQVGLCKKCLHQQRLARRKERNKKKVVREVLEESL